MIPIISGRPHAPQTCALPGCATSRNLSKLQLILFLKCGNPKNIEMWSWDCNRYILLDDPDYFGTTPRPPDVCATGLRYIPKSFKITINTISKMWKSKNIEMWSWDCNRYILLDDPDYF